MKEIQTEIQYDSPYLPILLRQAREAKGWSQESVAHGLCAVFYLSKIENGRIVPAPDLAHALVRRLDLMLENGARTKIAEKLDTFYDHKIVAFSSEEIASMERSTLVLDAKLVLYQDGELKDLLYYERFFDARQRRKYDELRFWKGHMSCQQFLERYADFEAYTFLAETCYRHHDLFASLDLWHKGLEMAQKAMNVDQMLEVLSGEVVTRGILYDVEGMLEVAGQARRLALQIGSDKALDWLCYNVGASLLEADRIDEALDHLLACRSESDLLHHKLALCYEKQGKIDLAREHIERARQLDSSIFYEVVVYRLTHPDHLREDVYKKMLEDCLQEAQDHYHRGFFLFHLRYMLDVLEARHEYKEAYGLLKRYFFTI